MAKLRYEPMKVGTCLVLPEGPDWIYEFKFDGWRMVAYCDDKKIRLFSRTSIDYASVFPTVTAGLVAAIAALQWVLDGELIAFDRQGYPDVRLVARRGGTKQFIAFDLLELDGQSLIHEPLSVRQQRLREILRPSSVVDQSPVYTNIIDAANFALEHKQEGIVAKRLSSHYRPGKRSAQWVKIKNPEASSAAKKPRSRS